MSSLFQLVYVFFCDKTETVKARRCENTENKLPPYCVSFNESRTIKVLVRDCNWESP